MVTEAGGSQTSVSMGYRRYRCKGETNSWGEAQASVCLTAQNCVMKETFRVVLSHMAATSHLCNGASVTQEVVILFNLNLNEYRCVCLAAPYWIARIRHFPGLDLAWLQMKEAKRF